MGVVTRDMTGRSLIAVVFAVAGTIIGSSLVWRHTAESASPPAHCVEYTPLDGSRDVEGDMRCAGLVLDFHHNGPTASTSPVWAGQWLVTDARGDLRLGWCVDHRGDHPLADAPAASEVLPLPNDPGGRRAAYLMWRYGQTTDDLVAAALWMVFHHYALDPAGAHRSATATTPLVPSLETIAASTGRVDLQTMAIALHTEAQTYAGDWTVVASTAADGRHVVVEVSAGTVPVAGHRVEVLVSGTDEPLVAATGEDGTATLDLGEGAAGTVVATAEAPGEVIGLRGVPARTSVVGAQLLAVAGPAAVMRASVDIGPPDDLDEGGPDTTTLTDPPVPTASDGGPVAVPVTGGPLDGGIAQAAVATLVAGTALLGTLRRRSATR